MDPEALAARRRFLEDSGWVGRTIGVGEPLEAEMITPLASYDDVRRIRLLQGYCG